MDYPTEILKHTNNGDHRNLIDFYKYWDTDAIKADLDKKRNPFSVIIENFAHDFNIGTVIRNSNAFLAQAVFICGRKRWDARGAVGTYRYQHVHHHYTLDETLEAASDLDSYTPIAIDNVEGAVDMREFEWPEKPLMIFGQEQIGVSPPAIEVADSVVFIPQMGSTRSINVGVASGIAMYDYISKNCS